MPRQLLALTALAGLCLAAVIASGPQTRSRAGGQADYSTYIVRPEDREVTVAQRLDRALTRSDVKGMMEGIVTGPSFSHEIPRRGDNLTNVATDFPFQILSFLGSGSTPYRIGSKITLRVQGGRTGTIEQAGESMPLIRPGAHLFVLAYDHHAFIGDNTDSVLIVPHAHAAFELRNGQVYGQGTLANFSEPVDQFRLHFRRG